MSSGGSRLASEEVTSNEPRAEEASEWPHRHQRSDAGLLHEEGSKLRSSPPSDTHLEQLDLATFPSQDLLRLLAALLHQIASANDLLRPAASRATPVNNEKRRRHRDRAVDSMEPLSRSSDLPSQKMRNTTAATSALQTPSSTLCFHARNVPSISIEAYLLRILKYCPTTNEVFLSLLVYFDRMSRMGQQTVASRTPSEISDASLIAAASDTPDTDSHTAESVEVDSHAGIRGFAIDSYNVHRLVIAGVTVASKFFSDVFYTNSRYAKVGGLPVHELNQLELQFLLLNDFNLMIPLEEMQHYANQLLFYGGTGPPQQLSPHPTAEATAEGTLRAAFQAAEGPDDSLTHTDPPSTRAAQDDVRMNSG